MSIQQVKTSEIKIIREPEVYCLGCQKIVDGELQRFLDDHGVSKWATDTNFAAEKLIETAGRLCYMSFSLPRPGGNKAYMDNILASAHGSVTEHAVWNFVVTGISRALSHEAVRHRAGMSPSQVSQRYTDESVAEYIEPDVIADDPGLHAIWLESVAASHNAYLKLVEGLNKKLTNDAYQTYLKNSPPLAAEAESPTLDTWLSRLDREQKTLLRKGARQAARSVLPNATETKLFLTFNGRALRHFIELRGSRHAEPEIRKLAFKLLAAARQAAPNLFDDYRIQKSTDGVEEITTAFRKV